MIYKIILGKNEINIDEEEKKFFIDNQVNKFIELKSGEIINTAFVQGIIIDHEATREANRYLEMRKNSGYIESPRGEVKPAGDLLKKYISNFNETTN